MIVVATFCRPVTSTDGNSTAEETKGKQRKMLKNGKWSGEVQGNRKIEQNC